MCKNVADTDIHIFEENISMVVVLHVYIQSCNVNKSNLERNRGLCYYIGPAVFLDNL